ncbi:MAG: 50S ribosomal protein L9 [Longimicrobiales bacterium]
MKLILRTAVEKLGESGDVIDVKDGYARNYLIPQGLAYVASSSNLRRLEAEQARAEEDAKRDYLEARRRAAQLEGVSLTFHVKAGEEGKLFGSVTNGDVADKLNQGGLDFEMDRRQIILEDPLKLLGVFEVPIRLHAQVEVSVEVRTERMEG